MLPVMREMVDRDRERRHLDAARTVPALIVVIGRRRIGRSFLLERTFAHQAALGGPAAGARLIIFGRDQFTPALRERAAAEGVHLIPVARLFQAE